MTSTPQDPVIRVVQWTTGNVARQSLRAIVERPGLELVGLYAHSEEKVGRDAGELAGLERSLGVVATGDLDEVIALRPDCVAYMPLEPDIAVMTRLLRAGINIVTTSEFLTGRAHGEAAIASLEAAAVEGGASVFGSGVNPGWIEHVAAVVSSPSREVEHVRVVESFNLALVAAEANQDDFGWGGPMDDPDHGDRIRAAVYEFADAVDLVAWLFDFPLDDVRCDVSFAAATKDLDVPGRQIAAGAVGGIQVAWVGATAGRDVVELVARWTMTSKLDPPWEVFNGYQIDVQGDPSIDLRLGFVPHSSATSVDDLLAMGHRVTAMPAVNAIPAVVRARPGIVTYADLPPVTAPIVGGAG